jgi:hypothetical protein
MAVVTRALASAHYCMSAYNCDTCTYCANDFFFIQLNISFNILEQEIELEGRNYILIDPAWPGLASSSHRLLPAPSEFMMSIQNGSGPGCLVQWYVGSESCLPT